MSNDMKTFLQCVKEAAELLDKPYTYDYINKISTEETEKLFNKAADIYASQSKSTIPVVMQAEGSEGFCISCEQNKITHELCLECAVKLGQENPKAFSDEAAVASEGREKHVRGGCIDRTRKKDGPCCYPIGTCDDCQIP